MVTRPGAKILKFIGFHPFIYGSYANSGMSHLCAEIRKASMLVVAGGAVFVRAPPEQVSKCNCF